MERRVLYLSDTGAIKSDLEGVASLSTMVNGLVWFIFSPTAHPADGP